VKSRISLILLIGILLLLASAVIYILMPARFNLFLAVFIPGILLVTVHFLSIGTRVKVRRKAPLQAFLLLMMLDSLFITGYALYAYAHPATTAAGWAALVVAGLGFLDYVSTLALWHWKRWGLALFQGTSVALAIFILLGGGTSGSSLILAGFMILGVIVLSLLLRSVRKHMV
jgi:ABC-type transport system involved in multi-copper enzyme maturation permease subunit